MTAKIFFTISGTYRSGTTMVERMIDQHPQAVVFPQPVPQLWIRAKTEFLNTRGSKDALPLGTLLLDSNNSPAALRTFLNAWPMNPGSVISEIVEAQRHYSGALTSEVDCLREMNPKTRGYVEFLHWIYHSLAKSSVKPLATAIGAKEILIEEFTSALISSGHRVILVVRDPRRVIASSIAPGGLAYSGRVRPTLFSLRVWRKSVAFALAFSDHPRVHIVKYEELLADNSRISTTFDFLGLKPHRVDVNDLADVYGLPWTKNSSFAGEPQELDTTTREFVEAATLPELLALGYPVDLRSVSLDALRDFIEPVPMERNDFPIGYSTSPTATEEEFRRLALLLSDELPDETAHRWFLDVRAYRRLREAASETLSQFVNFMN